jgi:phage gp29-like protein
MRLNHPNVTRDRYPEFYFDTTETEDMQVFSEALPKLVEIGFKIPRAWGHKKMGIPEPADDKEPVLEIVQPVAVQTIPNLAANTYLPQLLSGLIAANNQIPIEEQAIQLLLNDQAKHAQKTSEAWLQDLISKIQAGESDEEILAILSELYPTENEPALHEKLTQLFFAAEVFGRLSAEAEAENG